MKRLWLVPAAILVSLLLAACTAAPPTNTAPPTAAPRPTAAAPAAAASAPATSAGAGAATAVSVPSAVKQSTDFLSKLDVSIGAPPAVGWKWAVMKRAMGDAEVRESAKQHNENWVFFVIRGSAEIGADGGNKAVRDGEAIMIEKGKQHTLLYGPKTEILGFQVRQGDRQPGDMHWGALLYFSERNLEAKAGANYFVRLRELALAAGERRPETTLADPNFVYVIDGTLTARPSGDAVSAIAAGTAGTLPLNMKLVLANEGNTPLRFVLADLHQ